MFSHDGEEIKNHQVLSFKGTDHIMKASSTWPIFEGSMSNYHHMWIMVSIHEIFRHTLKTLFQFFLLKMINTFQIFPYSCSTEHWSKHWSFLKSVHSYYPEMSFQFFHLRLTTYLLNFLRLSLFGYKEISLLENSSKQFLRKQGWKVYLDEYKYKVAFLLLPNG